MPRPNFSDLIPSMRDISPPLENPESWIGGDGNIEHAIAYLTVFWPTFFVFDNCVFRGDLGDDSDSNFDNYYAFLERANGRRHVAEATLNHLHVVWLFSHSPNPTREQIVFVGSQIRDIWKAKLTHEFPDRRFEVHFNGDECHDNLEDYQVTFNQVPTET